MHTCGARPGQAVHPAARTRAAQHPTESCAAPHCSGHMAAPVPARLTAHKQALAPRNLLQPAQPAASGGTLAPEPRIDERAERRGGRPAAGARRRAPGRALQAGQGACGGRAARLAADGAARQAPAAPPAHARVAAGDERDLHRPHLRRQRPIFVSRDGRGRQAPWSAASGRRRVSVDAAVQASGSGGSPCTRCRYTSADSADTPCRRRSWGTQAAAHHADAAVHADQAARRARVQAGLAARVAAVGRPAVGGRAWRTALVVLLCAARQWSKRNTASARTRSAPSSHSSSPRKMWGSAAYGSAQAAPTGYRTTAAQRSVLLWGEVALRRRRACSCCSLSVSAAALPSEAEGAVAGASRSAASRCRRRRRRRRCASALGGPARSPGAAWISACASPRPSAPPPPPPGGAAGASACRTRESMMPLGEKT
jgi:hypothetical protein